MSAGSSNGIGPVSVRYAAQIQELLYAQAVHRMVAEQEATRQADQDRRSEILQPQASSDARTKTPTPAEIASVSSASDAAGTRTPAQLLDIQA